MACYDCATYVPGGKEGEGWSSSRPDYDFAMILGRNPSKSFLLTIVYSIYVQFFKTGNEFAIYNALAPNLPLYAFISYPISPFRTLSPISHHLLYKQLAQLRGWGCWWPPVRTQEQMQHTSETISVRGESRRLYAV